MKIERSSKDTLLFLFLPTLITTVLLIALSPVMVYTENNQGGFFLTVFYYFSRLLNCALYFIWFSYIFGLLSKKRISGLFLYLLFFFLFSFFRFFVSYLLLYSDMIIGETLLSFALSSLESAVFEAALLFAICLVSSISLMIAKAKRKDKFTKENAMFTLSLSTALSVFLFEFVMQTVSVVSFINEQLYVLYPAEIWSIIFDYIFICIVFLLGFFLCGFYIRRNGRFTID